MLKLDAAELDFRQLNDRLRHTREKDILIDHCLGQRYIAAGQKHKNIIINGIPGNALGAYMDGSEVSVNGNVQDAVGDTMNGGLIRVSGSAGDACGYAMRGGAIMIRENAGYRAGIHMKAYREKKPVLIIGNEAGSFLGEYQAGGLIAVLGLDTEKKVPVGRFCATGMHGGKIFLRADELPFDLPPQVMSHQATPEDMEELKPYIEEFCKSFGVKKAQIYAKKFLVLIPDTKNPYRRLYTPN